jgi:hypothetical protein
MRHLTVHRHQQTTQKLDNALPLAMRRLSQEEAEVLEKNLLAMATRKYRHDEESSSVPDNGPEEERP